MKNMFLKTIGTTTLVFLMITAFTRISVIAQDVTNVEKNEGQTQAEDMSRRNNKRALEGVWNIQVTGRNCVTGDVIRIFPAMHTYMEGGTMSDWGTGTPPSLRSNGQGIWSYESRRSYTSAFQFFRFNADGTYAGKQVGRATITVSNDENSFTTIGTGQVIDINGNVIQNACNTSTGTRFE